MYKRITKRQSVTARRRATAIIREVQTRLPLDYQQGFISDINNCQHKLEIPEIFIIKL